MGIFKKKKRDPNASDYVLEEDEESGDLPVAMAVHAVAVPESPPTAAIPIKGQAPPPTVATSITPMNPNNKSTVQVKMPVSRKPLLMSACPHCNFASKTRTRTAPSFLTWLSVGALAIVFWPICWIPLCMDQTRETKHYCTHCNAYIGKVTAFKDCCTQHSR